MNENECQQTILCSSCGIELVMEYEDDVASNLTCPWCGCVQDASSHYHKQGNMEVTARACDD